MSISSVFIHRIILQRGSGSPAAQQGEAFLGRRDSLPAFTGRLLGESGAVGFWGVGDGDGKEKGMEGNQKGLTSDVYSW